MPLSHLTLTVSHLATSTSFFLACLQPLGYRFIGRHDNHVGFGSRPNEPADFWITEERPGVPAGAAHIAFPAPSQDAVGAFFIAALKSGAKIHGEPCMRDPSQEYYSAAVIDADGNSIEAVHQPSHSGREGNGERALSVVKNGSVVSRTRSVKPETTISRATEMKPRSTISRTAPTMVSKSSSKAPTQHQQPQSYQSMAPVQQQQQQQMKQQQQQPVDDGSKQSKAIIGTLVGAAAGAAIAYTMMKSGDSQSEPQSQAPQYSEPFTNSPISMPAAQQAAAQAYRAIEAAPPPSSIGGGSNAYSAYARSVLSKNPRASTIMEDMEYCCSRAFEPASEGGSVYQGDFGGRRASSASLYDGTMDMPIRAIEAPPEGSVNGSQYYQRNNAPTFISSFAERSRSYDDNERSGSVYSTSTVKPRSHHSNAHSNSNSNHDNKSSTSSHRSHHSSRSSAHHHHHSSVITIKEVPSNPRSSTSSSKHSSRSNNHGNRNTPSTIFLDVVDVDSHVTPVPQHQSTASKSKSGYLPTGSAASYRSKASSKHSSKSSKFDEPVRPSDSVSQVSTNISKAPSKAPSKMSSTSKRSGASKVPGGSAAGSGMGIGGYGAGGSGIGFDFETGSRTSSRR